MTLSTSDFPPKICRFCGEEFAGHKTIHPKEECMLKACEEKFHVEFFDINSMAGGIRRISKFKFILRRIKMKKIKIPKKYSK